MLTWSEGSDSEGPDPPPTPNADAIKLPAAPDFLALIREQYFTHIVCW